MICRTAKYGARLSLIAENQVVTLSRHLATFKGLDQLPPCLITLHRESHRVLGYFSHKRFVRLSDGRTATDEIAMNPIHFAGRSVVAVMSTLAHEMVHLWQAHLGKYPLRVRGEFR
jgi:hypothetical protein